MMESSIIMRLLGTVMRIHALLWAAALLFSSGVVGNEQDKVPLFVFPPFGSNFIFNKMDTVVVTYTAFFDTAELWTFCRPGVGQQIYRQKAPGFSGSVPVLLNFTSDTPCWFNVRTGPDGIGENSATFNVLGVERSGGSQTFGPDNPPATATSTTTSSTSTSTSTTPATTPSSPSTPSWSDFGPPCNIPGPWQRSCTTGTTTTSNTNTNTDGSNSINNSGAQTTNPNGIASSSSSNTGLSPGASAGIGVGSALGVLALAAGIVLFCRRRRNQHRMRASMLQELDGSGSIGTSNNSHYHAGSSSSPGGVSEVGQYSYNSGVVGRDASAVMAGRKWQAYKMGGELSTENSPAEIATSGRGDTGRTHHEMPA